MDIKEAQRYLGEVDVKALSEAILAQEPQAWTEQLIRQQTYEVHRDTESMGLRFCDECWPEGGIHRAAGWGRLGNVWLAICSGWLLHQMCLVGVRVGRSR